MNARFMRFLLTGGVAAAANLGARYVLNMAMPFAAAVAVAYFFGMTTAYVLARLYVFERSGRSRLDEFKRFAIVNLFSLGLVWAISVGLAVVVFPRIGLGWHADDIAHLIGVLSPTVVSYAGHRSYTFAKMPAAERGSFEPSS